MMVDRRKTTDSVETASVLSVSSHRSDRRKTGECNIDSIEKNGKEKKTAVDRMRRKTTDNVIGQLSSALSAAPSSASKGLQDF